MSQFSWSPWACSLGWLQKALLSKCVIGAPGGSRRLGPSTPATCPGVWKSGSKWRSPSPSGSSVASICTHTPKDVGAGTAARRVSCLHACDGSSSAPLRSGRIWCRCSQPRRWFGLGRKGLRAVAASPVRGPADCLQLGWGVPLRTPWPSCTRILQEGGHSSSIPLPSHGELVLDQPWGPQSLHALPGVRAWPARHKGHLVDELARDEVPVQQCW